MLDIIFLNTSDTQKTVFFPIDLFFTVSQKAAFLHEAPFLQLSAIQNLFDYLVFFEKLNIFFIQHTRIYKWSGRFSFIKTPCCNTGSNCKMHSNVPQTCIWNVSDSVSPVADSCLILIGLSVWRRMNALVPSSLCH